MVVEFIVGLDNLSEETYFRSLVLSLSLSVWVRLNSCVVLRRWAVRSVGLRWVFGRCE